MGFRDYFNQSFLLLFKKFIFRIQIFGGKLIHVVNCTKSSLRYTTKFSNFLRWDALLGQQRSFSNIQGTACLSKTNLIALDILKLSEADFLVCTFSSNVCRIAYSLRTATKVDFLTKFLFCKSSRFESQHNEPFFAHL